jgi:hypothetical protein
MSLIAFVTDQLAIGKILDHLGLSSSEAAKPPPTARDVLRVAEQGDGWGVPAEWEVNTPPPEGGGFGEPLEVGLFRLKPTQAPPLKRAQAEGFVSPFGLSSPSTRNSASSSSCWFSMYCAITSSVTFPLLQQK